MQLQLQLQLQLRKYVRTRAIMRFCDSVTSCSDSLARAGSNIRRMRVRTYIRTYVRTRLRTLEDRGYYVTHVSTYVRRYVRTHARM